MAELNEKQKELVDELDSNVLLVAPAGTGKTESLAVRIANIINSKKALPEEILCITFTNKACKEMQDRIEHIIGKDGAKITVKTFHSFCLMIIKEQAKKKTDIFTDFTVGDEEDCKDIIKKFNNRQYPVNSLYRFICMLKEYRLKLNLLSEDNFGDYNKVIEYVFKHKSDDIDYMCMENKRINYELKDSLQRYGYVLMGKYNIELKKNHMVDFNDLIMAARKLFDDTEVVNQYKEVYKYINIDEVQDTSITEYSIIEKLFGNNNILLCGDKFQTIYGWRGSQPDSIESRFIEKYKPNIIQFSKNYRATKLLTDASTSYLCNVFPDQYKNTYSDTIEAKSLNEGEKIEYTCYEKREDEALGIKAKIDSMYLMDENPGKICILTRNNNINIELSKYLKNNSNQYEFALVDQYKFFRREEIKDIISFLKLIINKNDSISFERILKKLPTGIGAKTIELIESKEYKEAGIKLTDFIEENLTGEYFSLLLDTYNNNQPIIVFDVESTGTDVTEDEIIQIAAIKIDCEGEIIETFERFIKPSKSVGKSALVHGFSDEYLQANGEDKKIVFKDFKDFTEDALIIGHNVNYDISILNSELQRINMEKPKFKGVYDTLDIFRRFYPNLRNHKLETLSQRFPIKHSPTHNALDDVKATAYLLVYAIKNNIQNTSMERISLMSNHLKSFEKISNDINSLIRESENMRPYEILDYILNNFSFDKIYNIDYREEKFQRIADFKEFLRLFDNKEKNNRDALIEVINLTSLSNGEIEELMIKRSGKTRIPIITVHQAKGLEFDYVFLAGLEENTFPSYQSIRSNDLTEEQRLFYVAMTRAKKKLFLSNIDTNTWGYNVLPSRFIDCIDPIYIK